MNKIYFFIFALLFIVFSFSIGFFIGDQRPKDIIEGISGTVSHTEFANGKSFLYLDSSPTQDNNRDGILGNDRDAWVSAFDKEILITMNNFRVGDFFSAKDLWKADESTSIGFNHYYILEFYEIRRKDN